MIFESLPFQIIKSLFAPLIRESCSLETIFWKFMPTCPEFMQFVSLKLFLPCFSSSFCCFPLVYCSIQSCTEVLVHLEPTATSISFTSCLLSIFLRLLALLPRRLSAISSPDSGRHLVSAELFLPDSSRSF